MSAPPLIVAPTTPSSIQIATPFSNTFVNSDTIPAGTNYYEPSYTLTYPSPTTFSNVYNPSIPTWITTVTVAPQPIDQNDNTYLSFYGITFDNRDVGAIIEIQLPWVPQPQNPVIENGRIRFGDFSMRLDTAPISNTVRTFDVPEFGLTNQQYSESIRTVQFVLTSSNVSYTLPSGTTGFFTNSYYPLSVVFDNITITPLLYPQFNIDTITNLYGITPSYRATFQGNSYQCIFPITNSYGAPNPAYSLYYGPTGYYNFGLWWPLPPLSEWDYQRTYFINERIIYDQNIYRALSTNIGQNPYNPAYWVLSDTNYPTWSSSTTYSTGLIVNYNGNAYYATFSSINFVPTTPNYVYWNPIASPNNTVTFTIKSPYKVEPYPDIFPLLSVSSTTSSEILPFITGNNTLQLTFSSASGFQSIPSSPLQLVINQTVFGAIKGVSTYPITILPVTITTTPTLTSPLSLITYQPFAYTYTIPDTLVNVGLRYNSNTTSTALVPYIANGTSIYEMLFRSTAGLTSAGTTRIVIEAILNGNTIATNDTTILTIATGIIITPSVPTGTLSFYKYEPFSYTFTTDPSIVGASFQVNRSSSELQTFLAVAGDLQSVVFSGSFLISYTNTLSLIVDLVVGSTIISTQTILVSVGAGRFFPPAPNQNFQLYQYENVSNTFGSNIEFLTVAPMTTILSSPSLPSGLTFSGSGNSFYLQGTPTLQVNQSNYQIIGSNSSNGKIVTSTISLRVNAQQIRITPSTSTLTGLTIDTPIDPIITTAIQPATIYANTFRYTWTSLPDGLSFQNNLGSNVTQPFQPLDGPLTITLVGSPSSSFASLMTSSGGNLYQTRLTATQTNQTGAQTVGTSLFNFSLGETVLVTVSNSATLYKDKPLGTTDVLITAGSFFAGSATIQSVTADSLPPGLSLVQYISPTVYRLTGTPTTVNLSGMYTFTATNTNGNTGSVVASIPVNPDVVTFGGNTPANGTVFSYIVSKTVSPLVFSATSTSTTTPPTYTASIPFANYGLTLDPVTGILSGTPTASLSSTTITITATNIFGTTATTTIVVTIVPDVFTWPTYTPTYFQNKAITPFEFNVSTLSGRPILSYSSTDLPTGLVINPDGLLLGTPTVASSGSFTIIASTGYTISNQVYTYTLIVDQLLIVQVNGTDTVSKVFSGVQYRVIQYSSDSSVNATFTIGALTPTTLATIAVTSDGLLSGDFTSGILDTIYSATLTAVYQGVTLTLPIYITVGSTNLIITAIRNGTTVTAASFSIVTGASSFYNGSTTSVTYTTSVEHGLQINNIVRISGFTGDEYWANMGNRPVTQIINSFQFRIVFPYNILVDISFSNSTTPGYINDAETYYTTATPHGLTPGSKQYTISGLSSSFYNRNLNFVTRVPTPTIFVYDLGYSPAPSLTQQNGLLTYTGQTSTSLTFTQPTQTTLTLFEYVPYSIPIQAVGPAGFIYYYSSLVPNGFQLIKDSSGLTATLSGISTIIVNQDIVVYANISGGNVSSIYIQLRTITPFFVNPQSGAGAYTALLRNDVEANAAQNARDNRTFPQVDPLAGPLMAPRAPDVVTPDDCLLKLCKKPCPTCHTMM
jgi:hypothetical protein